MPSLAHRPLLFKPRYLILQELRERHQRREFLWSLFQKTVGQYLPRKKPSTTPGYAHVHIYSKQSMTTTHVRHFNQLLYELRRDGLVNMDKTQRTFTITRSGLLWLKKCKDNIPFTMPQYKPVIVKSDRIIIVSYDILEKSKIFAEWIRRSLKTFGLQQLQRSVWVGKTQLPEEFISDLSRLRLINYIEIFEVTKSGSLRQKM